MAVGGLALPDAANTGAARDAGSGRLPAIQALRALAATMVVFGHLIGSARDHQALFGPMAALHYAGGAGVDIFFLISGFIMVQSSSRLFGSPAGPAEFLRRRLIRIVPLYWLATLVTVMLMQGHGRTASGEAIMASLAFIPFDTAGRGDGMAFPLLDLGWTLNYEMMFYLIFALCLPLSRRRCVAACAAVLTAFVLAGALVSPLPIALYFWSRPITVEFVAGMGLALMADKWRPFWPTTARLTLVVLAAVLYWDDPCKLFELKTTPNELIRLLGWGAPAALMLIAASTGPVRMDNAAGRALVALGDASYALYLLHPFVIITLVKIGQRIALLAGIGAWGFILAGLAAAFGLAVIAHRIVEAPLTRILLARTRHFASVSVATAA